MVIALELVNFIEKGSDNIHFGERFFRRLKECRG
jgi:hypothetical protein